MGTGAIDAPDMMKLRSKMSGQKKGGQDGRAPGAGGYSKRGKPRPGHGRVPPRQA